MSATGDPRANGFTLMEMLVVLAILGLIGGIVYPGLERAAAAQQYRAALATSTTALRVARARGLSSGGTVRLVASGDGGAVLVDADAPVRLPRGVRVGTTPQAGIVFHGDGSSDGGSMVVAGATRTVRLAVAPDTGLIRASAG